MGLEGGLVGEAGVVAADGVAEGLGLCRGHLPLYREVMLAFDVLGSDVEIGRIQQAFRFEIDCRNERRCKEAGFLYRCGRV